MTIYQTIIAFGRALSTLTTLAWQSLWSEPMPSNFFVKLAPYLAGTGASLINLDENESGTDDLVGQLLIFAADVIESVTTDGDIPPLPEILSSSVAGKITGPARTAIILTSAPIAIAQFQLAATHPKASKALKYTGQVLAALSAGRTVPTAPSF